MAYLLYINGQQVDIEPGQVIAQTKQVNDLNSLSNRQANYTNTFRLPMTARNIKIMQYLSIPGNASNIPYQKNECSLYSESGECFVYKGWANITQTSDYYEAHIIDGITDLYKRIENTTLSNLGISELNHTKSVAVVKDSWTNPATKYKYILADYNGNTGATNTGEVNIDYLVPSVSVKYLWDKIFAFAGATYSGAVFMMQQFQNLYMTFPKGIKTSDSETLLFESKDYTFVGYGTAKKYYAKYNTFDTFLIPSATNQIHLKVLEAGTYRVDISGNLETREYLTINGEPSGSVPANSKLFIAKNAELIPADQVGVFKQFDQLTSVPSLTDFEDAKVFNLDALDSICIVVQSANPIPWKMFRVEDENSLTVTLTKLDYNPIDFEEALIDFSTKDFLNEVVHRFGLTMFKDKYSNNYRFLTLQELLQTSQIVDWSSKFTRKISESYIYGTYAQRNYFKYAYNDKEGSHNDGYIDVNNINLVEKKDVIKSKIYSPESTKTKYLNSLRNVYKMWEKQVVEATDEEPETIEYKSLDNRYYFMRAETVTTDDPITIVSLDTAGSDTATTYMIENYWKLAFWDVIQDFYLPMQLILQKATIQKIQLYLKEVDIVNFRFDKLYYIEQLSSYFLINKIENYVPGKPTTCEVVRVLYSEEIAQTLPITIYQVQTIDNTVIISFNTTIQAASMFVQYTSDGTNWTGTARPVESPVVVVVADSVIRVRLKITTFLSNEVDVNIPSNEIITIP